MRKNIELTGEQEVLVAEMVEWFYSTTAPQTYRYIGAAGTGKTTVLEAFIESVSVEHYNALAYVGKAVTILSQHGFPAQTIHSCIYDIEYVPKKNSMGEYMHRANGELLLETVFFLKRKLADDIQLLIVDEASMVDDDLVKDILAFGIKTIFLGDVNQCLPIEGRCTILNDPDYKLTQIMRQSADNPIVQLSQAILNDERIPYGTYGSCHVLPTISIGSNWKEYDIIITGTNRVRDLINAHIRHHILGRQSLLPEVHDRIICRQNNWEKCVDGNIYLTNGLIGNITRLKIDDIGDYQFYNIDFKPDITHDEFLGLDLDSRYIILDYLERKQYGKSQFEKFEYGYCITVHSAQGSEYPRVLYIDQYFPDPDFLKRIRYTAITRAVESIDIATSFILGD